jgi:hypothetical protein
MFPNGTGLEQKYRGFSKHALAGAIYDDRYVLAVSFDASNEDSWLWPFSSYRSITLSRF